MLSRLVVFCAVLGVALAALALAPHEPIPEKYKDVEGCYIGQLDAMIPLGGSRPSTKSCMEYRCGAQWVQYVSCGSVGVSPTQELVRDLTKPYPGCCGTVRERVAPVNSTES